MINDESWLFRNSRAVYRPRDRIIETANECSGLPVIKTKLSL